MDGVENHSNYHLSLQINNLLLVPSTAVLLAKTEFDPSLDLSCVDTIMNASIPLHKEVGKALQEKFGAKVDVREGE